MCITVCSAPGETPADFAARLSRFWTHMLRTRLDDFERVYAEMTQFEQARDRWTRKYALEPAVVDRLEAEMARAGVEHEPIDREDTYSKYETVAPDWMQIEH